MSFQTMGGLRAIIRISAGLFPPPPPPPPPPP
ncbi:hypothetical protein AC84_6148, partial [Escherichia coli 1-392-07_S4_C1]